MNNLMIFFMITYFAIAAGGFFAIFKYTYMKEEKLYDAFKETMNKVISNNYIDSFEDIQLIFNSINNNRKNNYKFKKHLEKYIVEMMSEEIALSEEIKDQKSIINKIKKYIKEIEISSPFEKLPENEKIICNDILSFIQNNDNENAKEKLYSLSNMIYLREETVEKLKTSNKFSIPIAIIGIILTIAFGIMSLKNE